MSTYKAFTIPAIPPDLHDKTNIRNLIVSSSS